MTFPDGGRDAGNHLRSFDPGPTARAAGPWTRMRRSVALRQAAMVDSPRFDPGLNVQLPGPWTRLRRSGSDLALDLPVVPKLGDLSQGLGDLVPFERLAGLARGAPVAAALVGAVAVTSILAQPRSRPQTQATSPVAIATPAPPRAAAAPRQAQPPGQVEAKLVGGEAVLPDSAPRALKQVVAAANEIQGRPYVYGGGHSSFESSGYDCSGAVSYALHGAGLLDSPLASGALAGWGEPGEGKAVTVYAHSGHTYAVIAGLRWDTSGSGHSGPSWHRDLRSSAGYVARHPRGY